MHFKNFNLILMLVAGIIVGVVSMVFSYSLNRLMLTLLVVLGLFYIIGTLIQQLINGIFDATDKEKREKEMAELDEEEKELAETDNSGSMTENQQE